MPISGATLRVAVLIPCRNEETTIAKVISDFRAALPAAIVRVFDNNSTDATIEIASRAGALVRRVGLQGKGNVLRRMFADIEADVYLLVDGDDTYDAASAPKLIELLTSDSLDMVVGVRVPTAAAAYRRGHMYGNRLLTGFLSWLFGRNCTDILSGYRVFSRRFVKSFPVFSSGFEIETELTVHALEMSMPVGEIATPYKERPEGSTSKLKTYSDGARILFTIVRLFSIERPFLFYDGIACALALVSILLAVPIVSTYLETGLVPRFPTAILSTGLMLLSALFAFTGLILATVTHGRRELKMLAYLRLGTPTADTPWLARRGPPREIRTSHPDNHFYSPVVDPAEVDVERTWPAEPQVLGIDFADASHEHILREVFPRFIADYDYPEQLDETPDLTRFYTRNSQFGWLDSRSLFVLLREWQPRRLIEVGSGFSTLLAADVNQRFLDGRTEISCIEPFPCEFLRNKIAGLDRLIERKVQDVPLTEFERLAAGDVLFIDSSHVAKTDSDVNFLYFEVLPRLARGVRVHIHDIFLPHDYLREWVIDDHRSWNEQYLLRALLMHSSAFRVVFGCRYAYHRYPHWVRAALALPGGQAFGGGSFWIERI